MKTKHKTLEFKKNSILELNDKSMFTIQGGTTTPCAWVSEAVSFATDIIEETIDQTVNGTSATTYDGGYTGSMDQGGKL